MALVLIPLSALSCDVPMVTVTLNRPLTIRSIIASSSSSLVLVLFMAAYAFLPIPRLNRSGSLTMKLRY